MTTKLIAASLISLLVITGTYIALNSDLQEEQQDFHGNLTPTEHMLCKANQFQANDYNNCIQNYRDMNCQGNYFSFLNQYRADETQFRQVYERQPSDVKAVVDGWNSSCNTFEHYKRCGEAEKLFTQCVYGGRSTPCSRENQEYINAAYDCDNQGDVTMWVQGQLSAECMTKIVGLAKGDLATALQCK